MTQDDRWHLKHIEKLRDYTQIMIKAVKCKCEVDDILHDAIVRLSKAAEKGVGPSTKEQERSYATKTVHNLIMSKVQKKSPKTSAIVASAPARCLSPVQEACLREYLEMTSHIIEGLGAADRKLLVDFCLQKPLSEAERRTVILAVIPVFADLCQEASIPIKTTKDARNLVELYELDRTRGAQDD